jgi:hypothetical protein
MSMTGNLAPFVDMMLLIRIFAVVEPAVRVDLPYGYSIFSPPNVSLVRSISSLRYVMPTTNDPYVTLRPFGTSELRMNLIVLVLLSM